MAFSKPRNRRRLRWMRSGSLGFSCRCDRRCHNNTHSFCHNIAEQDCACQRTVCTPLPVGRSAGRPLGYCSFPLMTPVRLSEVCQQEKTLEPAGNPTRKATGKRRKTRPNIRYLGPMCKVLCWPPAMETASLVSQQGHASCNSIDISGMPAMPCTRHTGCVK